MNFNNISTKIVENNSKNYQKEEKTKLNFTPFECINFSKFDEMRKKLESFYLELNKSITESKDNKEHEEIKKLENENVQKAFYATLEKILVEISLIKDDKLRIGKIDDVFKWFKNKVASFQNNKIVIKSSKNQYEKFPVPSNYKKSELIDNGKNQQEFEKGNKINIEEIDSPRIRLKQIKNKKIIPIKIKIIDDKITKYSNVLKSNEISFQLDAIYPNTIKREKNFIKKNIIINNSTREQSATSSNNLRGTQYSNNFFSNANNSNSENLKFPYYYNSSNNLLRSKFIIINEEELLSNKNKEINEKRNYEEMKEFLNEWEIYKAKYKEEIEKKNELKNILNLHEKTFKERKDLETSNSISLQSLTTNRSFPSPIKLKNKKNSTFFSVKNNPGLCITSTDNFSVNSVVMKIYYNKHEEELEEANKNLKERIRKENRIFENFNRLNFKNIKNFRSANNNEEQNNDNSIRMSNIHFPFKNNLIKINIRFNDYGMPKKQLSIIPHLKKSLDKIPSENITLFKTHDKIFQSKHNFSKLLNINELDNERETYKINEDLYFNDNTNANAVSISPTGIMNTQRMATGFDFTYKNSENCENENFNFNSFANSKNNFLMQRRTISFNNKGFYNSNQNLLTQKTKMRKNNFNFSHDAIKKAFLPPSDDKVYPKYFLPEPGFGLLTRTTIISPEKKKK